MDDNANQMVGKNQEKIKIKQEMPQFLQYDQQFQQSSQIFLNTHWIQPLQQSFIYNINRQPQNICYLFPIKDHPSPQFINSFNDLFRNKDLAYFHKIWKENQQEIFKHILFLFKNWDMFQFQFSGPLQNFAHIADIKIRGNPMYEKLYPNFPKLIDFIQKKLQIKADKKKAPKSQTKPPSSDILFQKYVEELQSLSKRQGAFYIKGQNNQTKTPIGQFIAQNDGFKGNITWKDIFYIAACSNRQNQFKNMRENQQVLEQKRNRKKIIDKMTDFGKKKKQILVPATNRICCARVFYYNFDIYDRTINNCHILTGRKLKKLDEPKDKQQVKQTMLDIISLLNCGGGVILFNTIRNYLQIWPKGQSIIESDQQKYRKIIENQIQNITPKIKIEQQIFIYFVPVAKNPYIAGGGISEDDKEAIFYIKGLYVMKIVVRPKNSQNLYYYQSYGNISSSYIENQKRKTIRGKQMIKFYKDKLQNIIQSQQQDEQVKSMLSKNINNFQDHQKCVLPQIGLKALQRKLLQNSHDENIQKYQKSYQYLTLLVANKSNHNEIKQKLKSRGTQCQIVVKYQQYKFKAANNSAALYHNQRFDRLLTQIAYNKQFQFNGRFVLTILVTEYLKLPERNQNNPFPLDQFLNLQKWLSGEHKNEKLTLWRYENGQAAQFYLTTQSKISKLYMYYVLNQYNEKCIFKNPPNYEKMTNEQKKIFIKQYYPQINSTKR